MPRVRILSSTSRTASAPGVSKPTFQSTALLTVSHEHAGNSEGIRLSNQREIWKEPGETTGSGQGAGFSEQPEVSGDPERESGYQQGSEPDEN